MSSQFKKSKEVFLEDKATKKICEDTIIACYICQ